MGFALFLDLGIILLLAVVIVYTAMLNRRLAVLRSSKDEFEQLFSGFSQATGKAETGLTAMRETAADSGKLLDEKIKSARGLADDLTFLLERGEAQAGRLETAIARGRDGAAMAPAAEARSTLGAIARSMADAEPAPAASAGKGQRGAALIKALREMR